MTGTITFWNKERAFGFIRDDARESFFLHIADTISGPVIPSIGDSVEFDATGPKPGRTNRQAINARVGASAVIR